MNTLNGAVTIRTLHVSYLVGLRSSRRHCLRVRYQTPRLRGYGSGTGPLDTDSRGPVPDPEPGL